MVSVVMVVYNVEKFIKETIDSIISQTFSDFELIIVDDGSTDNSTQIIENYEDKRIKLVYNTHDYIRSLNLGMSSAQGEYIVRMDGDDLMLPDRLETQVSYMNTHLDIDVCGSWIEFFGASFNNTIYRYRTLHKMIARNMILKNCICHPSTIIRCSTLRNHKINLNSLYDQQYIYAEDYKLWVDLIILGFRFAVIPKVLLRYRLSSSQITFTKNKLVREKAISVQYIYIYFVANKIKQVKPDCSNFIDNAFELFEKNKISFFLLKNIIFNLSN